MKIISDFINNHLKETPNILHFGSSLTTNKFNDIDLLIVSNSEKRIISESLLFKDHLFELLIIPSNDIFKVIELDKATGIYYEIIKDGKILKDENNLLSEIKEIIQLKNIKTYPYLKKKDIHRKIKEILTNINSLDSLEITLYISSLFERIIELKLLEYNIVNSKTLKHKLKLINRYNPEFYNKLRKEKNEFLLNNSVDKLINSLNALIPFKSVLHQDKFSNRHNYSIPPNDSCTIYLNPNTDLNSTFKLISKLNVIAFKISKPTKFLLENGIYLIVFNDNNSLTNILNTHKFEVDYPYQLNLMNYLGIFDNNLINYLNKRFITLTNQLSINVISKGNNLLLFIRYLILSYIESGLTKKELTDDLNFIGKEWGHNFINPSSIKNELHFKLSYSRLNNYILDLFNESLIKWNISYLPPASFNSEGINFRLFNQKNRIQIITFLPTVFFIEEPHIIKIFHNIGKFLNSLNES